MNKKKIIIIGCSLLVIILLCVLIFLNDKNDEISSVVSIDSSIDLDNGDEKVDWDSLDSSLIDLDGKSINIDKDGVYTLNGSINNGSVIVNTTGDVKLILDNVIISNNNGPAIIIEEANNVVIELMDGSKNILSDGKEYSNSEYDGCIYSADDLILQGNGSLEVNGNYLDGIVSNDDLKIVSGTYIIDSLDDGIRGKDSVYIIDGNFTINSGGGGIKSTNDTDTGKGYVNISGGTFKIDSSLDGIQAETKLIISDGTFDIKTASGSESSGSAMDKYFGGGSSYDDVSSKGLKAGDNLVIKGGTFLIDSKDDSIHSNNYVGISNGVINISSGDDGIHADEDIIIDSGEIEILKSYEGIEASNITINDGNIKIIASDDGINISGGNDSSSMNDRPGANNFNKSSGELIINGGIIYVDASGDGLDANGSITINNGEVYVDGPTDSGNGPLDYDTSFDINGGKFIAVGSSGMAQNVSDSSKQYSIMFYLNSSYDGENIYLINEDDNVIFEYKASKKFQSVIISTPDINDGNTYTLKIGNQEIDEITVSGITNSNGGFGGGYMGGGNMPMPGRR